MDLFKVDGSNWNPANWWPNAKKFFSEQFDRFYQWVLDLIHDFIIWLVNMAFDFCDWFATLITDAMNDVFGAENVASFATDSSELMAKVNLFFPLNTFFNCVGLFCGFCLVVWVTRRIIKFIPFIGG